VITRKGNKDRVLSRHIPFKSHRIM